MNKNKTKPAPRLVRIYSNEHGAWWAPRYRGYRDNPLRAGIFRYEDAKAEYPDLDYDRSKEDYLVDYELTAEDIKTDTIFFTREEFRDKYMGILFADEAEFDALMGRADAAVEAVFRELLAEVRMVGEKPQ